MTKGLLAAVVFCITVTTAYAYNQDELYYQESRAHSPLGYKCALASQYIKSNNCGPKGCDIGLCVALQHGCHIQSWGHVCPYPYPYKMPLESRQ
jgi:hypothetical protein